MTAKNSVGSVENDVSVEQQVRETLAELCAALQDLLAHMSTPVERAADLERALQIDAPLAWRVFRIASAASPMDAVEHLPTVNQLRRAVTEAMSHVPQASGDRALRAVESLASMTQALGGDQRGFESLVSAIAPGGVKRVELQHRRTAFRANTHLWGAQVKCLSLVIIVHPNPATGTFDGYFIHGYHEMRPTRPDVSMAIQTWISVENTEGASPPVSQQAEFLDDFSTIERPSLTSYRREDGSFATRIRLRGMTPSDAKTLMVGRSVDRAFDPTEEVCDLKLFVSWPCEALHADVLVPVGLSTPESVAVEGFACRDDPRRAMQLHPEHRIPLHEAPRVYRGVTCPPASANYPRGREVIDQVLDRRGWSGTKFDCYRIQVPFPTLHSVVRMMIKPTKA